MPEKVGEEMSEKMTSEAVENLLRSLLGTRETLNHTNELIKRTVDELNSAKTKEEKEQITARLEFHKAVARRWKALERLLINSLKEEHGIDPMRYEHNLLDEWRKEKKSTESMREEVGRRYREHIIG